MRQEGEGDEELRDSGSVSAIWFLVVLALASCTTRSIEAFCSELDEGMAELYARASDAEGQDNPFAGLAIVMGSLGEFQLLLNRLADVAPSEIREDVEVTRDVMSRQLDVGSAASDPLGALAGSLGDSFMHQASFERVDRFARQHCGQPVFGP